MDHLQALESADHGILAFDTCGHGVGSKLATAAVGHHHHRSQETEEDLSHHGADEETHAGARGAAFVIAAVALQERVDQQADHSGEKHDEGVQDALEQCHGDHVAIGDVGHLVGENTLDFALAHLVQQTRADGDQSVVARAASGERVGLRAVVDAHVRHGDSGFLGLLTNRLHQPLLSAVRRGFDEFDGIRPDGHPFGDQQ